MIIGGVNQRRADVRWLAWMTFPCSRLMAGAKRRTESGCQSAAPVSRREASAPPASKSVAPTYGAGNSQPRYFGVH